MERLSVSSPYGAPLSVPSAVPERAAAGRTAQTAATTILLVDDFGQIRDLATKVLTRHGYRVLAAASGEEALAVADSHRDHIDLLLTDVMMTGISGPELAERIVTVKPGIKVLYMSGYPGDQLQNRFSVNGPDWFIAKPFTPAELAGKVRQVLETPARP